METWVTYTQKEVNKIYRHIPTRTLRWWGLMGLFGWSREISDGRGISRQYEMENLYQIGVVEDLSSLNIPIPIIKDIMENHFATPAPRGEMVDQESGVLSGTSSEGEWNKLDFDRLMKQILVIRRTPHPSKVQRGSRTRLTYGWDSELTYHYSIESGKLDEPDTVILVNLPYIKKRVDALVEQA